MLPRLILLLLTLSLVPLAITTAAAQPFAAQAIEEEEIDPDPLEADFFEFGFDDFGDKFPYRITVDIASMIILIGCIYYPVHRKKDYFFTFFMFNITIFFVTLLMNEVGLSTGAAFGLFAVFSLLRYRTEDIDAKDMTYLFTCIALGLLSAVNTGNLLEMLLANGIIIGTAYLLDGQFLLRTETVKNIQYDDVSKIRPEQEAELIADLRRRTGLEIHRVEVGRVDYLRDSANVKVYYYETPRKRY